MSAAAIAIIVVVAAIAVVVIAALAAARRRRLQRRFGPEYDRVVAEKRSQFRAENELAGRERRIGQLEIRPLTAGARARYAAEWAAIQQQFVDEPQQAVMAAQRLVVSVMTERGYPVEDDHQVMADLSVEHANTLGNYRMAEEISRNASAASTEDLRRAMVDYRALFSELLGGPDSSGPDSVTAGHPETA
jgi:Tfp pilus assembly protein PilX